MSMMPPPQQQGPSFTDKLKMGAMMGCGVGVGLGFVIGNIQYLIYGARGKGYLGTLANAITTSGASFGFFMAVGSVIRTEGAREIAYSPQAHVTARPAAMVSAELRDSYARMAAMRSSS